MNFEKELKKKNTRDNFLAKKNKKLSGFIIGNTSKSHHKSKFYFTPIRSTEKMILSGIITYSESYAKIASKYLDGKVDYVLVDSEKKLPPKKMGILPT